MWMLVLFYILGMAFQIFMQYVLEFHADFAYIDVEEDLPHRWSPQWLCVLIAIGLGLAALLVWLVDSLLMGIYCLIFFVIGFMVALMMNVFYEQPQWLEWKEEHSFLYVSYILAIGLGVCGLMNILMMFGV